VRETQTETAEKLNRLKAFVAFHYLAFERISAFYHIKTAILCDYTDAFARRAGYVETAFFSAFMLLSVRPKRSFKKYRNVIV
jgi:hypothetical protein